MLWLCIVGIGDIGCFMFEVPWRILETAKELKLQGLSVIAFPLYVLGWVLHVMVRVLWYGSFAVIGGLFVYAVNDMCLLSGGACFAPKTYSRKGVINCGDCILIC